MGFGPDQLRDKALLALEEAVQECRFRAPKRSMALRFALAYLWAYRPSDRRPYEDFWQALAKEDMWRFSSADGALSHIYRLLSVKRDDDLAMRLWEKAGAEERRKRAETKRPTVVGPD
jgi:hypothetical protein